MGIRVFGPEPGQVGVHVTEGPFLRQLLLRLTAAGYRLFRNQVGLGWFGEFVGKQGDLTLLRNARQYRCGLTVGASDLIGWKAVKITPDMVGSRLAVFVAIEAKTGKVRVTPDQARFLAAVQESGGEGRVERDSSSSMSSRSVAGL